MHYEYVLPLVAGTFLKEDIPYFINNDNIASSKVEDPNKSLKKIKKRNKVFGFFCFGKKGREVERTFEEASVNTDPVRYRQIPSNKSKFEIRENMSNDKLPYAPSINSLSFDDEEDIDNLLAGQRSPPQRPRPRRSSRVPESPAENTAGTSSPRRGLFRNSIMIEIGGPVGDDVASNREIPELQQNISDQPQVIYNKETSKLEENTSFQREDAIAKYMDATPDESSTARRFFSGMSRKIKTPSKDTTAKSILSRSIREETRKDDADIKPEDSEEVTYISTKAIPISKDSIIKRSSPIFKPREIKKEPEDYPYKSIDKIPDITTAESIKSFEKGVQTQSTFLDPKKARQAEAYNQFAHSKLDRSLEQTKDDIRFSKQSDYSKSVPESKKSSQIQKFYAKKRDPTYNREKIDSPEKQKKEMIEDLNQIKETEFSKPPPTMRKIPKEELICPTVAAQTNSAGVPCTITIKNEELLAHDIWALTKVHFKEDGSKEFEIIEVSPVPPGQYLFQCPNKFTIFERNYCKK